MNKNSPEAIQDFLINISFSIESQMQERYPSVTDLNDFDFEKERPYLSHWMDVVKNEIKLNRQVLPKGASFVIGVNNRGDCKSAFFYSPTKEEIRNFVLKNYLRSNVFCSFSNPIYHPEFTTKISEEILYFYGASYLGDKEVLFMDTNLKEEIVVSEVA
jgi:hypothetical protein